MSDNAEDRYEGGNVAEHRRKMPSQRDGLTYKFEIASGMGGTFSGYLTANVYSDGRMGELFLIGLGAAGETLDGFAQWAVMDWSLAIQHGADFDMMCKKHAAMKFEPRGMLINQPGDLPIPYCHSVPALIAEWCAFRFGAANGYPDLWQQMAQIRENLRSH